MRAFTGYVSWAVLSLLLCASACRSRLLDSSQADGSSTSSTKDLSFDHPRDLSLRVDLSVTDLSHAPRDLGARDASQGLCGRGNCRGCCQNNQCLDYNQLSATACGFDGVACINCGPKGTCLKGACATPQPGCGPANCSGCCLDANHCSYGTVDDACGFGGQLCQGCGPSSNTVECIPRTGGGGSCGGQQTCGRGTCSGCCQGNVCEIGQSTSACGTGGRACATCGAGESCVGFCQAPPFCTAKNCSTCCLGNQCVAGDSDSACGEQSNPCDDCAAQGEICLDHQCVPGCAPSNCAGCCEGNVCAVGTQDIACGVSGETCFDCTALHGKCAQGLCQP